MSNNLLIQILEQSVKKHGPDKVLTLGHLLNILKLIEKKLDEQEEQFEINCRVLDDTWGDS